MGRGAGHALADCVVFASARRPATVHTAATSDAKFIKTDALSKRMPNVQLQFGSETARWWCEENTVGEPPGKWCQQRAARAAFHRSQGKSAGRSEMNRLPYQDTVHKTTDSSQGDSRAAFRNRDSRCVMSDTNAKLISDNNLAKPNIIFF